MPRRSNLIDRPAAARVLGISIATLDRWLKRGIVPCVKKGHRRLFSVKRLREWDKKRERKFEPDA